MKAKGALITIFAVVLLLWVSTSAYATSVLVSSPHYYSYGVGDSDYENFTAELNTATGNRVSFANNFENLTQVMSYDALLLQLRYENNSLSASESSNLQSFISTGRRVLMIGENVNWSFWNQQILNVAGGTDISSGLGYIGTNSVLNNELTNAVANLMLVFPGQSSGGVSLYDHNFATLWGANQNTLTVLDANVFEDGYWSYYSSGQFATNVAYWLAGSQPVPEPATMLLLGLGLVGLAGIRRKL